MIDPITRRAVDAAAADPRVFPLAGISARYTARLGELNSESLQADGSVQYFDTINVEDQDGEVVDAMTVESSENDTGYRWALADAGWIIVGRDPITGNWRVRRARPSDTQNPV